MPALSDHQLLRYSRHILLPEVDVSGQMRLLEAQVAVVGLGGLGCPAALYLAAAGVGRLRLIDPDRVELSNLQRQIAHIEAATGTLKVDSARDQISLRNSDCRIEAVPVPWHAQLLDGVNLVLDCTDNFATRYAINADCVAAGIPLVTTAATRLEGQSLSCDFRNGTAACYACVYGPPPSRGEVRRDGCAESGVLASVTGVMGSLQATEALGILLDLDVPQRMTVWDARRGEFRQFQVQRQKDCTVCSERPEQAA